MQTSNFEKFEKEKDLLNRLESKSVKAFKEFYVSYSDELLIVAYGVLSNAQQATNAVNELFQNLWKAGKFDHIEPPIYEFLYSELVKQLPKSQNP